MSSEMLQANWTEQRLSDLWLVHFCFLLPDSQHSAIFWLQLSIRPSTPWHRVVFSFSQDTNTYFDFIFTHHILRIVLSTTILLQ